MEYPLAEHAMCSNARVCEFKGTLVAERESHLPVELGLRASTFTGVLPLFSGGDQVADGYGTMLVTGVGQSTEWGKLMAAGQDPEEAGSKLAKLEEMKEAGQVERGNMVHRLNTAKRCVGVHQAARLSCLVILNRGLHERATGGAPVHLKAPCCLIWEVGSAGDLPCSIALFLTGPI